MYTVYVLRSERNGKRYVGFTTVDIKTRLDWHKWGLTPWTKQNGPFELLHTETYESKNKAMSREKYLKTGQGRRTIDLLLAKKG